MRFRTLREQKFVVVGLRSGKYLIRTPKITTQVCLQNTDPATEKDNLLNCSTKLDYDIYIIYVVDIFIHTTILAQLHFNLIIIKS